MGDLLSIDPQVAAPRSGRFPRLAAKVVAEAQALRAGRLAATELFRLRSGCSVVS
jgi:hypothetical protein